MIISNVSTDFLIAKTYITYTIKYCIAFKLVVKKNIKESILSNEEKKDSRNCVVTAMLCTAVQNDIYVHLMNIVIKTSIHFTCIKNQPLKDK